MTISTSRAGRADENHPVFDAHGEHRQRIAGRTLAHRTGSAVEARSMPGALDGTVGEDVAEGHREILVGAVVGDSRDAPAMPDETNRLARRFDDAERPLLGYFIDFCDSFETRVFSHSVGANIDYPDKFT